jgi:ribosomal protein S18 acetylase RimI-like enzyme
MLGLMQGRVLRPRHGPALTVRPLRHGDTKTVLAVFERMSDQSRRARFHGPKPTLSSRELAQLAIVDERHYVLVAYVHGDSTPVAIARLACNGDAAEIAFAVADEYQQLGIGSALTAELAADARAAGIREIIAHVSSDNPVAIALVRHLSRALHISRSGSELAIRAAIA